MEGLERGEREMIKRKGAGPTVKIIKIFHVVGFTHSREDEKL